jgi:hypothetical protein
MPKKPFQKGHAKMGGRKKGTPNKFTTAKQAFLDAFEKLGGDEFIIKVAKTPKGRQCVLNNMARLLPSKTELSGPDGEPLKLNVSVNVNLVKPKKKEEEK